MNDKGTEALPKGEVASLSRAVILDVPILDEFFFDWVITQLRRILRQLQSDGPLVSVSEVILRYLRPLARFTILLTTHAQTPASRLLGLHRVPKMSGGNSKRQPTHLSQQDYYFRLVAYSILSSIIPLIYEELKEWHRRRLRERMVDESMRSRANETNHIEQISAERKFKSADILIKWVSRIWPVLRLTAIVGVWTGVLKTSEVAMILAGWTYQKQPQHEQPPRLHVDYAQRRWMWEELLRTLRVWGQGLALTAVWRQDFQRCKDYLNSMLVRQRTRTSLEESREELQNGSCCFCGKREMVIPLKLHPCSHVACYACLVQRREPSVRCRSCGLRVVDSSPFLHS